MGSKDEDGNKAATIRMNDLMSKAIPAEARIPKLLRGNDGQLFLAPVVPETKKKLSRCWLDCCPDEDREFPLRTVVCCSMFLNGAGMTLFYLSLLDYPSTEHDFWHKSGLLWPFFSGRNFDASGKFSLTLQGILQLLRGRQTQNCITEILYIQESIYSGSGSVCLRAFCAYYVPGQDGGQCGNNHYSTPSVSLDLSLVLSPRRLPTSTAEASGGEES